VRLKTGVQYFGLSEAKLRQAEQAHKESLPAKKVEVAACEKLLDQLKEALDRSEAAEEELTSAVASGESDDMNGIGPLKLEQRRIKQEIESQEQRLKRLREACLFSPSTLRDQWEDVELALDLVFRFGLNEWEGRHYQVSRVKQPQPEAAPTAAASSASSSHTQSTSRRRSAPAADDEEQKEGGANKKQRTHEGAVIVTSLDDGDKQQPAVGSSRPRASSFARFASLLLSPFTSRINSPAAHNTSDQQTTQ